MVVHTEISLDPLGVQSVGQTSKRTTRDYSVNSPRSKKSASIDECLNNITDLIKDHKLQKARVNKQEEEMDKVVKIMKEDGLEEYLVFHVQDMVAVAAIMESQDSTYTEVKWQLGTYAPFFDGCFEALDETHVKVKVNKEAKIDHINRKGDVSMNVCAIVDMDGLFTYVGVGMAGSVHDKSLLVQNIKPNCAIGSIVAGRYYLVDGAWIRIRNLPTVSLVQLNASNSMSAVREFISLGLWGQ
ncbi:uncharacterized protein [Miscanthus floridulus]|uniref:uncharacterized protein n=1 Tax=Miscanthus floridulus TaxID=154761 RepID=UPI00345A0F72